MPFLHFLNDSLKDQLIFGAKDDCLGKQFYPKKKYKTVQISLKFQSVDKDRIFDTAYCKCTELVDKITIV